MGRPALNINEITDYIQILNHIKIYKNSYLTQLAEDFNTSPPNMLKKLKILKENEYIISKQESLNAPKYYSLNYQGILKGVIQNYLQELKDIDSSWEDPFPQHSELKKVIKFLEKNIKNLCNEETSKMMVKALFIYGGPQKTLAGTFINIIDSLKIISVEFKLSDIYWNEFAEKISSWSETTEMIMFFKENNFYK